MDEKSLLPAILFTTLALLLLIIASVVVFVAANRQRIRQKIMLVEAQAHYEHELRTIAAEVQEQTLTNISEELHSNIGQLLTLVHVQLQASESKVQCDVPTLSLAGANLIEAMKQIRQLSHSFSKEVLTSKGLVIMVRQEVDRVRQNGKIQVFFYEGSGNNEPDLSSDQTLVVFRIFQEVVNNALKHSEAAVLNIRICADNPFSLEIEDDGIGFDAAVASNHSKGAGLQHMQQRAVLAKLQCTITSNQGKGTLCRIEKI